MRVLGVFLLIVSVLATGDDRRLRQHAGLDVAAGYKCFMEFCEF